MIRNSGPLQILGTYFVQGHQSSVDQDHQLLCDFFPLKLAAKLRMEPRL